MVWILPPSDTEERDSYGAMYQRILSTHRRASLVSASSVVMLVATNVDALCASRMLVTLFKHDDIGYTLIPVSGRIKFAEVIRKLRESHVDLHSLLLIDMGGNYDLPLDEYLGVLNPKVTIHVIDSARPYSLFNLFMGGENGDRFFLWDDGGVESILDLKEAWEITEYEPEPDSDKDSDGNTDEEDEEAADMENLSEDDEDAEDGSKKRRRKEESGARKRQRKGDRISDEDWEAHQDRIEKHYNTGAYYGRSVACIMYTLAVMLEREDNELLWLGILGLTYQYIASRISAKTYENERELFFDEVARLNPQPQENDNVHSFLSINPDDIGIRATTELRFTLLRHWTLYDSMFNSGYVAGKLGLWREKGKSRLSGLLAKMGLSITQAQQSYSHMDMDLKKNLVSKLEEVAPEYGLTDYTYESFMKCYGFHTQPLSAADAVEGLDTLLEVAEGIRLEVEIEGTRNGGEWFGVGRIWQPDAQEKRQVAQVEVSKNSKAIDAVGMPETQNNSESKEFDWWERNFWTAYDAIGSIQSLRRSLDLAMSVHRAIHRTGTAIIDRQDIKNMRNHRVILLTQGPDILLFSHYGMLRRLALWLVDALRDRMPVPENGQVKRRALPVIVACLNEIKASYIVIGVSASLDFGNVHKNKFAMSFIKAVSDLNLDLEFSSFDCSILELDKNDLKIFLDKVCSI
ncbi:CDC45 family [Crepidotus variabilis]|uniref:CDC45 family n=1 Tax=Crepidotus variabilis TaxID=179855 RepID=A0A9P6JTV3_9AGAR|nr:CDC45 family [Crepidotus variabilis]